jgi:hypothetical protein
MKPLELRIATALLAILGSGTLHGASLAQDKGRGISDPESEIAGSLRDYIPDGSTAVTGVEVRAAMPAWWTVSRGSRKVYILGVPWLFRPDVGWNKIRLTNRLRDSREGRIILPPLLKGDDRPAGLLSGATPDTDPIPEAYNDRIRKAAGAVGQPAERYLNSSPLLAGYRLTTDFRAKAGLTPELVTVQVIETAHQVAVYPSLAGTVSWPEVSSVPAPGAGLACLDAALEEVEAGKPAFDRAMEAWANGDVRTALTAPRGLERCSFAFPIESQIHQDGIKLQVDAIKSRLLPGATTSVAVVYLRGLLSADGVLAQLQAQGYKIDAPKS